MHSGPPLHIYTRRRSRRLLRLLGSGVLLLHGWRSWRQLRSTLLPCAARSHSRRQWRFAVLRLQHGAPECHRRSPTLDQSGLRR